MFFKLHDAIIQNNIRRIQTSKRGINIFGSHRKVQLASSILSKLPNINKDRTGNIWNAFRDKDNRLTIESIATTLFGPKIIQAMEMLFTTKIDAILKNPDASKILNHDITILKNVLKNSNYNRMITKEEFIEYLRRINRLSSIEFDSPELRRLFKLDFYSTTTDKTVLNLLYEKN